MLAIRHRLQAARARRALRTATLPWAELEAEARRQACSPADIFFDLAGRPGPDPLTVPTIHPGRDRPDRHRPRRVPRDIYGRPRDPRPASEDAW